MNAAIELPKDLSEKYKNVDLFSITMARDAADFAAELLALRLKFEKALEILQDHEWHKYDYGLKHYCFSCHWAKKSGHDPNCVLAELLRGS